MNFEEYRGRHFRKIQKGIAAVCWIGAGLSLAVQLLIFYMYLSNGFWKKGGSVPAENTARKAAAADLKAAFFPGAA